MKKYKMQKASLIFANIGIYVFLGFLSILTFGPYLWIVFASFKSNSEIFMGPFSLPKELLINNYIEAAKVGHLDEYYINSIIVTAATVLLYVPLISLAAYPFAKINFFGKNFFLPLLVFGLSVPFQAYMISLHTVLKNIRALNTYWGMILPLIAQHIPFGIFFMRAFFLTVPDAIIDAAKIDGATEVQVISQILMPISKSAAVSLAIFQMVAAWNSFMIPLLYVNTGKLRTLTLGFMYYSSEYSTNYSWTMSGAVIVSLPIIIVFLIFRRGFIRGLAAGSIK
jgi:raffinose/stachyose/melibiose transport system permease protein